MDENLIVLEKLVKITDVRLQLGEQIDELLEVLRRCPDLEFTKRCVPLLLNDVDSLTNKLGYCKRDIKIIEKKYKSESKSLSERRTKRGKPLPQNVEEARKVGEKMLGKKGTKNVRKKKAPKNKTR